MICPPPIVHYVVVHWLFGVAQFIGCVVIWESFKFLWKMLDK